MTITGVDESMTTINVIMSTHFDDSGEIMPSRQVKPEKALATTARNQSKVTALPIVVCESGSEYWIVATAPPKRTNAIVMMMKIWLAAFSASLSRNIRSSSTALGKTPLESTWAKKSPNINWSKEVHPKTSMFQ